MRNYSDELEFVSVVVPSYNRYHYLEELVDSVHKNADIPFELVVHDDNSNDGTRDKILSNLKDKVSSIILNNGLNLGLAGSINRATTIAGSNYIIMLNADCIISYPVFRDIVNVLKCPFVGCISLMTMAGDNPDIMLINDDTKFQFIRGIGAGCALAYRKDIFDKIGGWYNHVVASGNSDVSFMIRLIKAGYFITALNVVNHDPHVRNLSNERKNCQDSTISDIYYDVSYPRLFGLEKSKYLKLFNIHQTGRSILDPKIGEEIYAQLSRKRFENAVDIMQTTYRAEEGDTNIEWADRFVHKLIKDDYSIDKEVAKKYGHDKWINDIDNCKIKSEI